MPRKQPKDKAFWNGNDLKELKAIVNQLDKEMVALKVEVKAGSQKALVAAVNRVAKAIENANDATLQKQINAITARVLASKEKLYGAQKGPQTS